MNAMYAQKYLGKGFVDIYCVQDPEHWTKLEVSVLLQLES